MTTDMRELQEAFFQEAAELLAEMEGLLLGLDAAAPGGDELNAIFRAAHSIKGGASTFGFAEMTVLAHALEGLLDRLRCGELGLDRDVVDALLAAGDALKLQLAARRGGDEADAAGPARVCERLQALAPGPARREPCASVPAAGERIASGGAIDPSSIRVSIEKVDRLIGLVGELVVAQGMLARAALRLDPVAYETLHEGLSLLERHTRGLQEAVMAIRMVPMGVVYARFPRMVRDLAARLNKEVELRTSGEEIELDRRLIEKIVDPLTHLVRNSLDHGIEPPERRVAAGKLARGTIALGAFHSGGSVVIEVSDDGAGLDRRRILAKAKEHGLDADESLPDREVWKLIFEAGFSTAEAVTDVSGRGVGMDVVKRNIEALGGSVEVESAPGTGTRVSIRVPLMPGDDGRHVRRSRNHGLLTA